jgi:hypothetical protein
LLIENQALGVLGFFNQQSLNHKSTIVLQRRRPGSQPSLLGYAPERGKDERPGTGGASRDTSAILAAS